MTDTSVQSLFEVEFKGPKWLNADFLQRHLRSYYKSDGVVVQNFTVQPATAAGENFASSIYRIKVYFCNGDRVSLMMVYDEYDLFEYVCSYQLAVI